MTYEALSHGTDISITLVELVVHEQVLLVHDVVDSTKARGQHHCLDKLAMAIR